jgi:hypothetical protein
VLYPFFGILLLPVIAAAAMALSSVSVIANALRLCTLRDDALTRAYCCLCSLAWSCSGFFLAFVEAIAFSSQCAPFVLEPMPFSAAWS